MKYTISLIDDEPLSLAASKGIIQDFFSDIHIMATFDNTLEAMKMLSQVPCDLLLVDIRMPGMNGLEFVNTLREFQNVEAIFLTGYDEFAIQALKTGAFDYLLKPLNPNDLKESLKRFRDKKQKQLALEQSQNNQKFERLLVNRNDKMMLLEYRQINRLNANGPYTHIYLTNNEQIVATKALKHFEAALVGKGFVRAHRAHIFNVNNIAEVRKDADGNGVVSFREGKEVFVTTDCKNFLGRYITMLHGTNTGEE